MKNRFGFIPIVLPAIVMVLIIGLINMTGVSQTPVVEAQSDPRLMDLSMTYNVTGGPTDAASVELMRSGGTGFSPTRTEYTVGVDNDASTLVVSVEAGSGYEVEAGSSPTGAAEARAAVATVSLTDGEGTHSVTFDAVNDSVYISVVVFKEALADDGTVANDGLDDADAQTEYMIKVSRDSFPINVTNDHSPHLADADTGLQVLSVAFDDGAQGTALTGLSRHAKGGLQSWNNAINSYHITVPHANPQVIVSATPGTYAAAGGADDTPYTVAFRPRDTVGDADNATGNATTTVVLNSGQAKTIYVDVSAPGGKSTYTLRIERSHPALGTLTVTPLDDADPPAAVSGAEVNALSSLEAEVAYQYDSSTVAATPGGADPDTLGADGSTSTVRFISPADLAPPDAGGTDSTPGLQMNLDPGDNTVKIRVSQFVRTVGTTTVTEGTVTTRDYTLTITRNAPQITNLNIPGVIEPVGGTDAEIPNFAPTDIEYEANVGFDIGRVTLNLANPVGAVPAGEDPLKVTFSPRDKDPVASGSQFDLEPGENVIKVTVTSAERSASKTTYTFTITRAQTMLSTLSVTCHGADPNDTVCDDATERPLTPSDTTTPTGFVPEKMMYTATTSYAGTTSTVTVSVTSTEVVKFTMPSEDAGELSAAQSLRVGNNVFSVDVGTSATGPGNTSTYTLTVDRMEPQPVIQFKLYDVNGDEIDPPDDTQLPLELVSATRRYTMDRDDGFSVNVRSVRMNAYLGDGVEGEDVKVSVGRVSIPMAASLGDFLNYHTLDLAEGSNTIAFEVEFRQHPDDTSLSGRSVHTLTISREGNSQPAFRPNHSLGQALIEMVDGVEVDTSTTALPHAVNGNGVLTYTLVGKGGKDLPEGLEFEEPTGRTADGWIEGIPNIQPRGAYADHTLILKVVDEDDVTGASDEDMVEFTIRIFRDEEARRAAQPTPAVGPGQLINLGVYYDDPAQPDMPATCKGLLMRRSDETPASDRKDCGILMPKFDPATMRYMVDVPTDVETVDIHAVATSSATLTLRGPGSPELGAGSGIVAVGDNKRHEWNGYRVLNGSPAQTDNIYIVKVTEGSHEPKEYRLTIRRETDTPVAFAAADKADIDLRFYEDIPPVNKTGSGEVTLPAAMPGSGNGATSTWVYALERTDKGTTAEKIEKLNFEGLKLNTSTRKLEGTPTLQSDEGRPSDRNGAPGEYSVTDADLNTEASDGDTIDVDITVYRDVTLSSFSVGDVTVADLGESSRKISSAWSAGDVNDDYSDWVYTWDGSDDSGAMLVDAYTFPVSHSATEVALSVVKSHPDAAVSIDGAAGTSKSVTLGRGDNVVMVTVTNGDVSATHKINLVRPGLQASDITVTKDRGLMTDEAPAVKLAPAFDRDTYSYTAEVENWIETLRISATAVDQRATVSVNLDAINTAIGFAEVRLEEPQGSEDSVTTFRIGITNPTISEAPGLYILAVTRKGNTAPTFDMMQDDKTVKNGEAMTLKLPEAMGGNGDIMHKLTAAELPNGLTYSESTRTISGTPVLTVDQGFESDFVLTYTAVDADSDTSDADAAIQTFTLTVTNGDIPVEPVDDGFGPDENYNTLRSLVVSFQRTGDPERIATLVPAFNPSNGGPYTAIVPHDAANVWVTPSLSDAGAALWIDNIAQQDARKVKILSTTEIMVEHTTHPALGSMTYTVELSPTNQSVPSFAGVSIDDMVVLAGEDMGTVTLPAADGGNTDLQPLTYTLKDHGGREIPRRGIGGIHFDASARTLSGTPVLNADADKTIYKLSYQATDQDGDMSEVVPFMVTVCRDETLPGCDPTAPEPNPGATPMDLMVTRSGDTAMLTWRPGDDATKQVVVALDTSDLLASAMATLAELDSDADSAEISGLTEGVSYIYIVLGYDSAGNYKDAAGNLYAARYTGGN